ncbi:hypothetical protein BDZ89DRAFT_1078825, partial [Hymenopellis radicata]
MPGFRTAEPSTALTLAVRHLHARDMLPVCASSWRVASLNAARHALADAPLNASTVIDIPRLSPSSHILLLHCSRHPH